jgi:hypothetical protein
MRRLAIVLGLCNLALLALIVFACRGDVSSPVPSPLPLETPCADGRTREARAECLKVCKKGCVNRFPLDESRRLCLDACRVSCYEQFPPGVCLDLNELKED